MLAVKKELELFFSSLLYNFCKSTKFAAKLSILMSTFRKRALDEISSHKAERFYLELNPVSNYFGKNVFDLQKMKKYLSSSAYKAVLASVKEGEGINRNISDEIASGMKAWALELGATHYTHWFHPLTDSTAEKHEAFVDIDEDGKVFENFKGSALVQQEPDASSFPNGGLRNTFEARGYTAWDPTSPAFIIDRTLCIPTVFVSYTGESLDMKIPQLKSIKYVEKAATEVASMFDSNIKKTKTMLGIEQEYFVVDEALFRARPDLQLCGRTLIGHTSAKDQQLEDHYFGAIPSRVTAFMKDFETEAYKLGILLKTRHNEVAPNQFECAPLYSEANLAIDQNLVLMILMKKVAKMHHLKVLFHEKPFMGINGSGKHCNWSLIADNGVNLLSPGKTPSTNILFLSCFASVIKAVHKYNHLLMASVASLSNSCRLGGSEAPPAVMSAFIGSTLTKLLDAIENMESGDDLKVGKAKMNIVESIPEILFDNTDRNRTSPFAFTGNRFEFRAVGSSVNVASSMYILNTIVGQQLNSFKKEVEVEMSKGVSLQDAALKIVRQYITESKDIRFEGNGYSKEWQEEAARRGLKGINNITEAFKVFVEKDSVELFEDANILTKRELEARCEVMEETYVKKVQIEARVAGDLIINHIIPTAIKFQNSLIENVKGIKDLFGEEKCLVMCAKQMTMIEKISYYINDLRVNVHDMIEERKKANVVEDVALKAKMYSQNVFPYFDRIREKADKLEMVVDDEMWPLPKYRELLFCR